MSYNIGTTELVVEKVTLNVFGIFTILVFYFFHVHSLLQIIIKLSREYFIQKVNNIEGKCNRL